MMTVVAMAIAMRMVPVAPPTAIKSVEPRHSRSALVATMSAFVAGCLEEASTRPPAH